LKLPLLPEFVYVITQSPYFMPQFFQLLHDLVHDIAFVMSVALV
jgi:hypothetical protein